MTDLDQKMLIALIRIANWCGDRGIQEAVDEVYKEAFRKTPEARPPLIGLPVIDPSLLEVGK